MNLKKITLADVFLQYGSHYYLNYKINMEEAIVFEIGQRFGEAPYNERNVYGTLNEAFSMFKSQFRHDYTMYKDFHTIELHQLGPANFLSSLINKEKQEKRNYHQAQIDRLDEMARLTAADIISPNLNDIYNLHETNVYLRETIYIVDLRTKDKINVEITLVDEITPFIVNQNNISLRYKFRSFNIDQPEIIDLNFVDNYWTHDDGYHVFDNKEKAYDFAIEELMKSEYNDNLKMRSSMARKIDNLFG